jgi:hypothetical protein
MTKLKATPAALTAVEQAELLIAQREDELAIIEGDLAAAEAALSDLAAQEDDDAYETKSIEIERLRRSEVRVIRRLGTAREAFFEAERDEEQNRRRSTFAEGKKAASEADRLVQVYAEHARAIAETLRAIEKLREPVETANRDAPPGEREIDTHALSIHLSVELPASTPDGERFWYRPDGFGYGPLNPRPALQIFRQPVFANGRWILSDDDGYEAAVAAEKSKPTALAPVAQRTAPPPSKYGERLHEDGSRKITLPPVEWPPRNQAN